jgi:hypothetical protein
VRQVTEGRTLGATVTMLVAAGGIAMPGGVLGPAKDTGRRRQREVDGWLDFALGGSAAAPGQRAD